MAKKNKNDDYEFVAPDFDEEEFIRGEKRKARTSFASFAFGIVMGVICHFAWRGISPGYRWVLTLLLAVCAIGFLAKLLQLLKVDLSQFGKKEWLGSISFYFFTWLAIFIISINPPFYDASPPEIDSLALPAVQEAGSSVVIAAKVTDNVRVQEVRVNISHGDTWQESVMEKNQTVYTHLYQGNQTGTYTYVITARDTHGHRTTREGNFSFARDVVTVDLPSQPLDASDEIKIRVRSDISPENFLVFYVVDGAQVNATRSGTDTIGGHTYHVYTTIPSHQGWQQSSRLQMTVYARPTCYFVDVEEPVTGTVPGGTYNVSTAADSSIGTQPSPEIKDLPQPRPLQQVPGFELLAVLAAMGIILFFKRRS
ncbi:MAG TPA: hypothetical protein ENN54_01030 [Thermoplasmatales archaeon]|nr:hypothetical protein [Thermoplasmatales archaeon]